MTIDKARVELQQAIDALAHSAQADGVIDRSTAIWVCDAFKAYIDQQVAPPAEATDVMTSLDLFARGIGNALAPMGLQPMCRGALDTIAALRADVEAMRINAGAHSKLIGSLGEDSGRLIQENAAQAKRIEALEGAIAALLLSAKILQQNAVGCAVNHHALDFEEQGLPGWLADTQRDIERAAALASGKEG